MLGITNLSKCLLTTLAVALALVGATLLFLLPALLEPRSPSSSSSSSSKEENPDLSSHESPPSHLWLDDAFIREPRPQPRIHQGRLVQGINATYLHRLVPQLRAMRPAWAHLQPFPSSIPMEAAILSSREMQILLRYGVSGEALLSRVERVMKDQGGGRRYWSTQLTVGCADVASQPGSAGPGTLLSLPVSSSFWVRIRALASNLTNRTIQVDQGTWSWLPLTSSPTNQMHDPGPMPSRCIIPVALVSL
ncbi:MAG: hypothetical protein DHS80DRAFT_24865 [Piptocephalis tieghemiana]|nr:MAG: hypothetical protein DHS80DRAFT_24865 [Piptocephalis tieghemiana]